MIISWPPWDTQHNPVSRQRDRNKQWQAMKNQGYTEKGKLYEISIVYISGVWYLKYRMYYFFNFYYLLNVYHNRFIISYPESKAERIKNQILRNPNSNLTSSIGLSVSHSLLRAWRDRAWVPHSWCSFSWSLPGPLFYVFIFSQKTSFIPQNMNVFIT